MSESPQHAGPLSVAEIRQDLPPVNRSPWYQRLAAQKIGLRLSAGTLGLIILAFLILSIIVFPYLLVNAPSQSDTKGLSAVQRVTAMNDLAQTRNAVRTTLVQAIGGALLIISGGIAWAQVQTARRGQLTDRLTKSVDQLGNDKKEVRLGGIYALNQVAESPQYTRAVAEVLLAYLKTASPNPPTLASGGKASLDDALLTDSSPANWADLQAVLRILVTEKLWLRSEAGRLDLSLISVPFAHLQDAELGGSVMAGARLPSADLRGARLVQADMRNVVLEHADLSGADLSGAALTHSKLSLALIGLKTPAILRDVQASHADFSGADLSTSDLDGGVFEHADFSGAIMNSATLRNANFKNAILTGVHFEGADLSDSDFSGANLSDAHLRGAIFDRVTLDSKTRLDRIDVDDSARTKLNLSIIHESPEEQG
jgi:uncharacterized protein YjbI with pentapeptide repeats